MMKTKYFSNSLFHRIAILLLAGVAVYSKVEAQTITDVSSLEIKHRPSFMADKTEGPNGLNFPHEFLQSGQGMIQKTNSDGTIISIQNTSTYRMTRYVKQGVAVPLYLTTSQSTGSPSPQRRYQRWYDYDTELPLVNGTTCDLSKGSFRVLKYKNGLVMGTGIKGGGTGETYYAGFNFWGILPTGQEHMRIGADISCYNDWSYVTPGVHNHLRGLALHDGDTHAGHLRRKERLRLTDTVLNVDGTHVRIGALTEEDRDVG